VVTLKQIGVSLEEYQELFLDGFGESGGEIPHVVFSVQDGETRVAYCSVNGHSRGNLYLQHIFFAKGIEKKYGYYVETLKALHALGFPFIMGAISNKNKVALMWALRSGFEINGVRIATDGKVFVEVLHKGNWQED